MWAPFMLEEGDPLYELYYGEKCLCLHDTPKKSNEEMMIDLLQLSAESPFLWVWDG